MVESRRKIDNEDFVDMVIQKTLTRIGFDLSDPIEIQKDIAFLAKSRKNVEKTGAVAWGILVISVAGGLLSAVWVGIKKAIVE